MKNVCAIILGIFVTVASPAHAQRRLEDFYGIWVRVGNVQQCPNPRMRGMAEYFVIAKGNFRHGGDTRCHETVMTLVGDRLRLSASCSGEEEGYQPIVVQYSLDTDGLLIDEQGLRYQRCTDRRKWARELTAEEKENETYTATICKGERVARTSPRSDAAIDGVPNALALVVVFKNSQAKDGFGNVWMRIQYLDTMNKERKDLGSGFVLKSQLCLFRAP